MSYFLEVADHVAYSTVVPVAVDCPVGQTPSHELYSNARQHQNQV